jgi:hypothetical protein
MEEKYKNQLELKMVNLMKKKLDIYIFEFEKILRYFLLRQ